MLGSSFPIAIVSGPSGIGKDTLIKSAMRRGAARFEVPFTSRSRRSNERDGVEYFFLRLPEFQALIQQGTLLEWDFVLGNYYGFKASLVDSSTGPVITHSLARMALRLKRLQPHVRLVFLMPKDFGEVRRRLAARGIPEEEIRARVAHGEEELVHARLFDYVLTVRGAEDAVSGYQDLWREIGLSPAS